METDAKNPRQAGTVAKNPRCTDAKNPSQLAPLQKTPVTVWNVPTVAKNPYYRSKKTQPLKSGFELLPWAPILGSSCMSGSSYDLLYAQTKREHLETRNLDRCKYVVQVQ